MSERVVSGSRVKAKRERDRQSIQPHALNLRKTTTKQGNELVLCDISSLYVVLKGALYPIVL